MGLVSTLQKRRFFGRTQGVLACNSAFIPTRSLNGCIQEPGRYSASFPSLSFAALGNTMNVQFWWNWSSALAARLTCLDAAGNSPYPRYSAVSLTIRPLLHFICRWLMCDDGGHEAMAAKAAGGAGVARGTPS